MVKVVEQRRQLIYRDSLRKESNIAMICQFHIINLFGYEILSYKIVDTGTILGAEVESIKSVDGAIFLTFFWLALQEFL